MSDEQLRIEVRDAVSVTAFRTSGEDGRPRAVFVYAPGAGSNLFDPFGAFLAPALLERGIETWRFQFPNMEAGRKRPDPPALLEATWRAVIDHVRAETAAPLLAGGRSMGGRIASQVVAAGAEVDALALFAYPLIAPGRSQQPRTAHLSRIAAPTLFCSGTRDSFGTPAQIEEAARLAPRSRVHFLDGADHGFSVLKSSGRTRENVWQEATEALLSFVEAIIGE